MKPDWKDAPEWANWLAMDKDGCWEWYEVEPIKLGDCYFPKHGDARNAGKCSEFWEKSLEKRP